MSHIIKPITRGFSLADFEQICSMFELNVFPIKEYNPYSLVWNNILNRIIIPFFKKDIQISDLWNKKYVLIYIYIYIYLIN